MRRNDIDLSETDIRSVRAATWIVRGDEADARPWLASAPVCAALAHHAIRHLAVADMPAPFRIVRTRLGGSYFLASFDGEGRVLVDGRWTVCRAGVAVLLPPGTLQAFQTPVGGRSCGYPAFATGSNTERSPLWAPPISIQDRRRVYA